MMVISESSSKDGDGVVDMSCGSATGVDGPSSGDCGGGSATSAQREQPGCGSLDSILDFIFLEPLGILDLILLEDGPLGCGPK